MRNVKYEILTGESIGELNCLIMHYADKYAHDKFKVYFRNDTDLIALVRYEICNCKCDECNC